MVAMNCIDRDVCLIVPVFSVISIQIINGAIINIYLINMARQLDFPHFVSDLP